MPAPADEPLRRCNLYLYEKDVEWLRKRFGHGWSEYVRKAVRVYVREEGRPLLTFNPRTGTIRRV